MFVPNDKNIVVYIYIYIYIYMYIYIYYLTVLKIASGASLRLRM
jgi:hypothetical protein